MTSRREWPGPARAMAAGIEDAVTACRAGSSDDFAATLVALARVDREQLSVVLGSLTRDLVERAHPDGLDAEGAELLLRRCIRSAAAWYADLDSDALIRALTGALGMGDVDDGDAGDVDVGDREDAPRPDAGLVRNHGLVLIADLVTELQLDLGPVLDAALAELMRAQTVELP